MSFRRQCAQASSYYQILGVAPDANATEIRRAYKQVALHVHPDRVSNSRGGSRSGLRPGSSSSLFQEPPAPIATSILSSPSPGSQLSILRGATPKEGDVVSGDEEELLANERFKLVGEAYAVLGDEELRAQYDLELRAISSSPSFPSAYHHHEDHSLPAEDIWVEEGGSYQGLGGLEGSEDSEDDDEDGMNVPRFDDDEGLGGGVGYAAASVTCATGGEGFSAFFEREDDFGMARGSHRASSSSGIHQRRTSIGTPLGKPPLSRQDSRGASRSGTGDGPPGLRRQMSPVGDTATVGNRSGMGGKPPTAPPDQSLPSTPATSGQTKVRRSESSGGPRKASGAQSNIRHSTPNAPNKSRKSQPKFTTGPSPLQSAHGPAPRLVPEPRRDYVPEVIQEALLNDLSGGGDAWAFTSDIAGRKKQDRKSQAQRHQSSPAATGFMFEETQRLFEQPKGKPKGRGDRAEAQTQSRPTQAEEVPREDAAPDLVEANEMWDKTYRVDPRSGKVSKRPVSRVSGEPVVATTTNGFSRPLGGGDAAAANRKRGWAGGQPPPPTLPGINRSTSSLSYLDQQQKPPNGSGGSSNTRRGNTPSSVLPPSSSAWDRRQAREEELRTNLRTVGGRRRRHTPSAHSGNPHYSNAHVLSPIRSRDGSQVVSHPNSSTSDSMCKEDVSTKQRLRQAHRRTLDIFFS